MLEKIKLFFLNNKIIIIVSFTIFILTIGILNYGKFNKKNDFVIKNDMVEKIENNNLEVYTTVEYISVDIKGKVNHPGVYRVDNSLSRRVNDIIIMAGGLLKDADTSIINLAKKVFDEMVIVIYSKEEVKSFSEVEKIENNKINSCKETICDACVSTNNEIKNSLVEDNKDLININTASTEELMTLSGIGESKALEIIAYRNNNPFLKKEDIMNVKGIGESAYNKIKDNITV